MIIIKVLVILMVIKVMIVLLTQAFLKLAFSNYE